MKVSPTSSCLPWRMWLLITLYTMASLAHFAHNAEYIVYYPGIPLWMTRETVYLAWLVVGSVGLAAVYAMKLGWLRFGAMLLVVYGAFGIDGLLHYTLALCSQHTFITNLTIWAEASLGLLLVICAVVFARRVSVDVAQTAAT